MTLVNVLSNGKNRQSFAISVVTNLTMSLTLVVHTQNNDVFVLYNI
jgi:hypothetical protein